MRIAIDVSALLRLQPTGVERYVRQLLQAMMAQGSLPGEEMELWAPGEKPAGLTLPLGWRWCVLRWWPPKGWTHGRMSWECWRRPPDILFIPAHEVPLWTGRAAVVTTVHDAVFLDIPESYSWRARMRQRVALRRAVRRATQLLTVSAATRDALVRHRLLSSSDDVIVTPLALDAQPSSQDPLKTLQQWDLVSGEFVLFIGRIERKKDPLTLVRAMALVHQPCTLVLAGSDGVGAALVHAAIADSPVRTNIRCVGYCTDDERAALLAGARTLVLPSLGEGFGIPVLEAMAAGVPVIISDTPALREVAGDAALIVPMRDPVALAHAIERLRHDVVLHADLSTRGKLRAAEFSWEYTGMLTWRALRTVGQRLCTPMSSLPPSSM